MENQENINYNSEKNLRFLHYTEIFRHPVRCKIELKDGNQAYNKLFSENNMIYFRFEEDHKKKSKYIYISSSFNFSW